MTYDPEILTVSEKNTAETVCPTMGATAVMNLDRAGTIYFNATNLNLFNFAEESVFAQVVFDVNDIAEISPVTTTVDLNVEVLRVSEVDESTSMTDSSKEVILVNNSKVEDTTVVTFRNTTLTESTYVEPTTVAPTTVEPTTVETTTTPVEDTTTAPVEDTTTAPVEVPTETPDATSATGVTTGGSSTSDTPSSNNNTNNNANNNGTVQTGDASLAVIILSLLVVATGVMLALRKREMF